MAAGLFTEFLLEMALANRPTPVGHQQLVGLGQFLGQQTIELVIELNGVWWWGLWLSPRPRLRLSRTSNARLTTSLNDSPAMAAWERTRSDQAAGEFHRKGDLGIAHDEWPLHMLSLFEVAIRLAR